MAASPLTSRPDSSAAVMRIALQVGATPVAHVDIGTMLSGVCSALPPAVGVAAAVLVLTEAADPRDPEGQQVFGSDDAASRLGLIQQRAGRGPVPAAMRGDRALTVPDLTVSGPPELAAAAADCGLVRSLVVPLAVSGQPAGGLQMLAGADATLDERTAEDLWPLVAALSARLADARELARVSARVVEEVVEDEYPEVPPETTAVATVEEAVEHGEAAPDAVHEDPEPDVEESADENVDENVDDTVHQPTARLAPVVPAEEPPAGITQREPATDLFATGETTDETPPTGQARLGWEGPEHTPRPTALPTRAFPTRIPMLGRNPSPVPRPLPPAVPEQRSGPIPASVTPAPPDPEPVTTPPAVPVSAPEPGLDDADSPTWRVPRHRLRDDA